MFGYRPNTSSPIAGPEGASGHLVVDVNTITVGGQAVTLRHGYAVIASTNTITISGQSVLLRKGADKSIATAGLAITVGGQNVTLARGRKFTLAGAVYAADGQDIAMFKVKGIFAASLGVVVGAQNLTIFYGRRLKTDARDITINLQSLSLPRSIRKLQIGTATVTVAAQPMILAIYAKLLKLDVPTVSININDRLFTKLGRKDNDVTHLYNQSRGKRRFWEAVRAKEMRDPDW